MRGVKYIIVMPTFRFHKLQGKFKKYFAIDAKTKRDKWRIILQPLDEEEKEYDPLNIDEIAGVVKYAQRRLIPEDAYIEFKNQKQSFTGDDIRSFANVIDQDPGIVYGRLQIDGKIPYTETYLSGRLRHRYNVVIS